MTESDRQQEHETDVVVVGGGPVGAALAGDLGTRGIRTMLIELTDGVFKEPRMHAVNIRTMEFARRWGLEQALRDCGWPKDHPQDIVFMTKLTGHEIGRIPWKSIDETLPPAESPTFAQRCPQAWFNPIVMGFAQGQESVKVRLRWRCDSFEQAEDGVVVEATDLTDGRWQRIRAKYLIGCDGSRSEIRRRLGVDRDGSPVYGHAAEVIFRSPTLRELHNKGLAGRYTVLTKNGMSSSLLPFDGRDLYRLTLMVQASSVTKEEMEEAICALADVEFSFELVTPVLSWINREVNVGRYKVGRVLLAGDAAHGMPPTGGFGMNSGLIDAFDLSWKLAAVIDGWGGSHLLDSYDHERRQAITRTARMAASIYKDWIDMKPRLAAAGDLLEAETPEGEACRAALGTHLVSTFQREFNSIGGALGYDYDNSPISISDGTPKPADTLDTYIPTTRPGHRAPHAWLKDGRSTLDLFGSGFTLLDFGNARGAAAFTRAAAERFVPLSVVRMDDQTCADLYERRLVLVRPDGHVAWRGDESPEDVGGIIDVVRGALIKGDLRAEHAVVDLQA